MLKLTSFLIAFSCVWSVAVRAHAQQTQTESEYATAMVDAIQEYRAGKYPEARALFQRAHELRPNARTLRGLGLVEYKLNNRVEAVRLLTAAIHDARKALTPELKQEAQQLIRDMRAYIGSYRVLVSPAEATLTLDGSPADAGEEPLLLDAGEHVLSALAPGYQAQERRLHVRGGESEDLRFDLVPEPPAVVPAIATAPPLAEAPPPPQPAVHHVTVREEQALFARRTTWGWIACGAAAASLAGTIVAWRIGESAAAHWNDDERCLRDGNTREQNCGEYEDTTETARTWTTVGLVATGVFGSAAALLLWPRQEQTEHARAGAKCDVTGTGVACAVRF
ncbi:MAG TPA: hypothetical protein VJR89_42370 [Polyangiales bacterium]|nr:hypothetical protein [Polyangiales bacterium]